MNRKQPINEQEGRREAVRRLASYILAILFKLFHLPVDNILYQEWYFLLSYLLKSEMNRDASGLWAISLGQKSPGEPPTSA